MVKVTFVQWDGDAQTIDAPAGTPLMETAQNQGVPGIVADCGGNCSCGTCRVFVDPAWRAVVGEPNELEADMLEMHAEQREGQRLSCQVQLAEDLDGLVVSLPKSQF